MEDVHHAAPTHDGPLEVPWSSVAAARKARPLGRRSGLALQSTPKTHRGAWRLNVAGSIALRHPLIKTGGADGHPAATRGRRPYGTVTRMASGFATPRGLPGGVRVFSMGERDQRLA